MRVLAIILMLVIALPTSAQILQGNWVREADARIEKHRKTDIEVMVLDKEGAPVKGATVYVSQYRHDFAFGLRLDPSWFKETPPGRKELDKEVFRVFGAVSIEQSIDWKDVAGKKGGKLLADELDVMLRWAATHELPVRLSGALHSDADELPTSLRDADGKALDESLTKFLNALVRELDGRAARLDLYCHVKDKDVVAERLGNAAFRRIMEQLRSRKPAMKLNVQFDHSLKGPPLQNMLRKLTAWRDAFVTFDEVAVSASLGPTVVYRPVAEALNWIAATGTHVTLVNLEVGGPSEAAAAINLETVLRVAFSNPMVEGIYFNGASPSQLKDKSAALVDEEGLSTRAGTLLDKLVHTKWRTKANANTDFLGMARLRVFTGAYHISAVLDDGSEIPVHDVFIRKDKKRQRIIIQDIAYPKPAESKQP